MRAKVSVCFIVRDDADSGLLEECFESVRPHVEEIVVVDTGSKDATPEIAQRYADVFEVFTDCNDPETGAIANFALARNRAFALARQPWVMWMDSDDVLAGGEHLAKLVTVGDANRGPKDWCYLFPYEYVYDANGRCVCLHYRERLVSRAGAMRWVNPVHEVMIPAEGSALSLVPCDDVVFKHQRQRSKKPTESGRNLRIIQKLVEVDGSTDARQFYYLGLEYGNAGNVDKAVEWLSRYVAVSGWDDEKTMATLKLAEICYSRDQTHEGLVWAFRAIETHEGWGEGYFSLARGFYNLALRGVGNVQRNWEKCVHFGKMGLALPPTKTMLFVNPNERNLDIHVYMTMAYSQLGNARKALEHAEVAYKMTPGDPGLVYNKGVFERLVARDDLKKAVDRLVAVGGTSADVGRQIVGAVSGDDLTTPIDGWERYARPEGYPRNVEAKHFPVARKTPHARAFGIPEASDVDDLPVQMTDAQVEAATILLWKEYILHDEILAAERLLADPPYRAKHTVTIERALAQTRRMTAWMDDYAEQQAGNGPEDATIENGMALPKPLAGQLADRSRLALQAVRMGDRILDLGCFDGGITNRWGLLGHDVTAADLCENSIALARRKAEEFNTGVEYVCSKFSDLSFSEEFDVVTCCDTYEHVKDHVGDLIAPARRALRPGGRMVITTPHGSWMRGEYVKWAHPWRWAEDEGRTWNTDLPHAHLIAPTPWSVAEHFRSDGWWVKDSYVIESASAQDVQGQGNVYAEAHLVAPPAPEGGKLDIVFACGDAWEDWSPLVHRESGIGGSETMVVELARRLALAGHRVRVYTSTGKYGEGIFDGVEYRQTAMTDLAAKCDVLVAWRDSAQLARPIEAAARMLWVHDIFASNATHRHLLAADRVLGLSDWHRDFLATHHNLPDAQMARTRNGIDLSRFDGAESITRNPHKIVSSSSPDRGLPVLLKLWPEIRARVPDAELHVFYGFDNWRKIARARNDQAQLEAIAQMELRMAQLAGDGVVYRGKVDQVTLAREFLSAGVWAHPTWFSETSCCHPDTRVSIPGDHRGGPPTARIADLVGKTNFPVYAFDEKENRFQIATCTKVWQTKIADEMVGIRLDDGQLLRLTPDHLVLTFDGDWVEAGTLKPGDSLRALHYRYNVAIRDADGTWANEHRLVGEWMEGRPLRSDEHVDHDDLMRLDNRPEALHVLSAREHASKTHRGRKQSRLHEAKRVAAWREKLKDSHFHAGMTERLRKNGGKLWDMVNAMSPEARTAWLAARAAKRVLGERARRVDDPAYAAAFLERQRENGKKGADARWGKNHKVVCVERLPGGPVFDMEVAGLHNFVADGVVVHNCITAMEAQAAGLRIVTSAIAALNETVGSDYGVLVNGDWLAADYQAHFVDETARALTAPEGEWLKTRPEIQARAARDFGLDALAVEWVEMMRSLIASLRTAPLVPYKRRTDFAREAA